MSTTALPACHQDSPQHAAYVTRVEELEAEGCDTSDAQGIADMEFDGLLTQTKKPTKPNHKMKTKIENPSEIAESFLSTMETHRPRSIPDICLVRKNGKFLKLVPAMLGEPAQIDWTHATAATLLNFGSAHSLAYLLDGELLRHDQLFSLI
jgi:hypothetical protein